MWDAWFKVIGEGLTCPREDGTPTKEKTFESRLEGVGAEMMERFKANLCPKEKLANFDFKGFLGGGGAGKVFLVKRHRDEKKYALKVIEKDPSNRAANHRHVMEKKLTRAVRFKFIIRLHFVFQDPANFFFVMDSAPYGSLLDVLIKTELTEAMVKWYAAQMILAVQYLHSCKIAHRDLKPHNMLIFKDGFLKISDFGMAKIVETRTYSNCGTLAFLAPEVLYQIPYGTWVDWWSVGVTIYTLLYRDFPFPDFEEHGFSSFDNLTFPEGVVPESPVCDFIRRLLTQECSERLGCSLDGAGEIIEHRWFEDISFRDVYLKKLDLKPPLVRFEPKPIGHEELLLINKLNSEPRSSNQWFDSFCSK